MIEIAMMIAFILALLLSLWKLYIFFPNTPLADDDKNEASTEELNALIQRQLLSLSSKNLTQKSLYQAIIDDHTFDKDHFWRFNENRLRQLLKIFYLKYNITDTSDALLTLHSHIHQLKS